MKMILLQNFSKRAKKGLNSQFRDIILVNLKQLWRMLQKSEKNLP
jgi:hypothetical protein